MFTDFDGLQTMEFSYYNVKEPPTPEIDFSEQLDNLLKRNNDGQTKT